MSPDDSATSEDAVARAALTAVAEPGDPAMGGLLAARSPAEVWSALRAGAPLGAPPGCRDEAFRTRLPRWRARARAIDADTLLTLAGEHGVRLVLPGDPEWPSQLDPLAERRPYALWVRGAHDLRNACLRSVSMVGSRAASGYGLHVAAELSYSLAGRGWSVVSGGAYGIDGAAHRGALAGGAATVVVLACGLDISYPRGHERLFAEAAARGVLVSEYPPGTPPTRRSFLVRNRLIAALTPGTVVVEAGARSGAMNTAAHARELCRVLMAVPGPVTSALSVGCHRLLRDCQAVCVTDASDVVEQVGPIGADPGGGEGVRLEEDLLDDTAKRVLAALPSRGSAGVAGIAAGSGLDPESALRRLGLLAAAGYAERAGAGWRRRTPAGEGPGDRVRG
ncbi:DNA-processing protein DprA [Actinorugispora endophytica]|uniref:DNA processing protein n=1 Tax=Actinorugispora endophytica TaxID=1605990 RepID=A0A4R6VAN3_9ACTN|nr:DNA-processing protein DprA [Actinorugispora endophytica]TDQ53697.1 DNA processing protein [Actinorugispora endophytica]